MKVDASMPTAFANSRNSTTSRRRSPRSTFETNDCGLRSRFASSTCVSPAAFLARTSRRRNS